MRLLDRFRSPLAVQLDQRAQAAPAQLERRYHSSLGTIPWGGSWQRSDAARARPSGIVYRCVQLIAANAAALNLGVARESDEGEDTQELDFGHDIARLWNRPPNPAMSARLFKETIWSQLEYRGVSFVFQDRGPTGEADVATMWPIYDPVEVIVDDRTNPLAPTLLGFKVKTGRGTVPLLPSEMLWLRYPHRDDPWGWQAPLSAASFAVDLDAYAREWQAGEFRNGARVAGVVRLGDVTEEVFTQTVATFRARHEGPENAGKVLFTAGATEPGFDKIGLTPAEMSYIESRKVNAEEIALAFGVPRDLIFGQSTFDNQRAAKVFLWSETIVPKLEVVASEVDRQQLPSEGETAIFDISKVEALREGEDSKYNRARTAVYADVLTINESRRLLGFEPMEGGDVTQTAFRAPFRAAAATGGAGPGGGERTRGPATDIRAAAPRRAPVSIDAVQRAYDRHEPQVRRAVERLADKQRRDVKNKLGRLRAKQPDWQTRANAEDLFDAERWREASREALEGSVAGVWEDGAATMASALGLSFETFNERVLAAMHARLDTLAGQVTDTTLRVIGERILEPGVEEGESVPDLADRVLSVFDDLASWRAETIARTETVGGFNAASRTAAVSSGQVSARTWVAALDARVRDSHAELDGYVTQGLDDVYPNGLMHPGDPAGDPGETINCRCVEVFVLVEETAEEAA